MGDKVGTNIIDSVERLLRYLIPGAAAFLLFALSYPTIFGKVMCKISNSELFLFFVILTVGISIYVIHSLIIRFTLEPIAYLLNLSPVNVFSNDRCLGKYSESHAKLILKRENSKAYPKGYYIYLWAIWHYSFIIFELLFIFAFFHEIPSWAESNARNLIIVGTVILILSICSYFWMQVLEKNTIANVSSYETDPEKRENQADPND